MFNPRKLRVIVEMHPVDRDLSDTRAIYLAGASRHQRRSWRAQLAANLQDLGVAANATERGVRGQIRVNKLSGIYRAVQRGESTQLRARQIQVMHETVGAAGMSDPGREVLLKTRSRVVEGWLATMARLSASGDHRLAHDAREFVDQMPRVQTEKAMLVDRIHSVAKQRSIDSLPRTQ